MDSYAIDTERVFETPEGVDLSLRLAGPASRAQAWFVDFLLRLAVYIALIFILPKFGNFGLALYLISLFAMEWLYPVVFELAWNGSTPGKRWLGLRVVMDNGTPITGSASLLRNLLRVVDFAPFMYGFGLLAMLFNRDFKRWGDMAAGTIVVYFNSPIHAAPLLPYDGQEPSFDCSPDEQQAIVRFAERHSRLSTERTIELAEILSPLTERKGEAAVTQMFQFARWFVGREGQR